MAVSENRGTPKSSILDPDRPLYTIQSSLEVPLNHRKRRNVDVARSRAWVVSSSEHGGSPKRALVDLPENPASFVK